MKRREIDGLRWVSRKLEEERWEVEQEDVWTQREKKWRKKLGPGAGWAIGEEGAEKETGVQGVLQIHLSPRDSLEFVSGRLVINRLWSVCLTGGILGFDGRTLISLENSPKTDGLTNRRISPPKNYFISQPSPVSLTPGCLTLSRLLLTLKWPWVRKTSLFLSFPKHNLPPFCPSVPASFWPPFHSCPLTVELFTLRLTLLRNFQFLLKSLRVTHGVFSNFFVSLLACSALICIPFSQLLKMQHSQCL